MRIAGCISSLAAAAAFIHGFGSASASAQGTIRNSPVEIDHADDFVSNGKTQTCVSFKNVSDRPIRSVVFGIAHLNAAGEQSDYVKGVRTGSFGPGILIEGPGAGLVSGPAIKNCWQVKTTASDSDPRVTVLSVVYVDGSEWENPENGAQSPTSAPLAVATPQSAPTIDSVRAEIVSVAAELSPISARDAQFASVSADVSALEAQVAALTPKAEEATIMASLTRDVGRLTDAIALWSYAREHNPFPGSESLTVTTIPDTNSVYLAIQSKYAGQPGWITPAITNTPVSILMIGLTVGASSDARIRVPREVAAAAVQGTGSLSLRYPLTREDAETAIRLGTTINQDTLIGSNMEWHLRADRNNEGGAIPDALIETPFLKVALLAARRKARYESAPTVSSLSTLPDLKRLTAEIYVESGMLNAFSDSVCVIKQGEKVVHASRQTVGQPSVMSNAKYGYEIDCDFPMSTFDPHSPFTVTLANVTLFDLAAGSTSKGELHFDVDPSRMR